MRGSAGGKTGDLKDRSILEVLQDLHFLHATGVLEVDGGEHKRRLFLRDGSLYLAGTHPLARRLGELVKALSDQSNAAAATEARKRCLDLVERMARVIGEWRTGRYRFVEDPALLALDLVGPLPTQRLLMTGSTVGATPAQWLSTLGGERAALAAVAERDLPADPKDLLGLGPEEQFLLERLRQPMTLGEIVGESPLDRESTHRLLAQLLAARRIRVLGRADPEMAAPVQDAELLERFATRFERNLKEEPLQWTQEEFRTRVAELFARVGAMNYYELLDVDQAASAELIQTRYEALARLVHPANESAFGLTGLKPMLAMLFDRATQAYLALSDPERRRLYNQSQAIDLSTAKITGAEREVESKELARKYFEQSQVQVARGDFHYAVELLQLAVSLDRRSDYLLALARVELRNPKWLERAADSCRAALEIEPQNAEVRFVLGEIYELLGDMERARGQFTAATRSNPAHVQANAKLRNLPAAKPAQPGGEGGLFSRIFRKRDE
jgi:curved DNA-binding protein CbpA